METSFCLEALDAALAIAKPEIFNTDQGSQFTSSEFTGRLLNVNIAISMSGKGRAYDNILVERLWRTVKYEEVYLHAYEDGWDADRRLSSYFDFYCRHRPHGALGAKTPAEVYFA